MTENNCANCKYLSVIISQTSDYFCYEKDEYMNLSDFIENCDCFAKDNVSLKEKKDKVW